MKIRETTSGSDYLTKVCAVMAIVAVAILVALAIPQYTSRAADTEGPETANTSPGKTIHGVSFNPAGTVSCVNDTYLRVADANLLWGMSNKEYLSRVIFLPPYCIDYNPRVSDSVGVSKGKLQHAAQPEKIMDLFKDALECYFPEVPKENLLEEFKLVGAALRPNDSDPKLACWYFSCARYKDLRPELIAKEKFKSNGLIFMGMAVGGEGKILTSGSQMYYCDENLLRKLFEKSESIEDVARLASVLPPFFDNKDKGATKKGPSPFIIGGMFKRAQKACGIEQYIPLTAERFPCAKILVEGWLLTVVPSFLQ